MKEWRKERIAVEKEYPRKQAAPRRTKKYFLSSVSTTLYLAHVTNVLSHRKLPQTIHFELDFQF